MKVSRGFTLLELIVTLAIIAVLTTMMFTAAGTVRTTGQRAMCANSLRQLGVATALYRGEHGQRMFAYQASVPEGRLWYFGLETFASLGLPEGQRDVDGTQSPLYPYVRQVGGIEVCPAFPYQIGLWKPKYKGASWGYGFNKLLSGVNVLSIPRPSQVVLFGDCAQVNTFQAPASPRNPMVEEFYLINDLETTIQFRHGALAQFVFLDGHVEGFPLSAGTQDMRLPSANVGRITPIGSLKYLQ